MQSAGRIRASWAALPILSAVVFFDASALAESTNECAAGKDAPIRLTGGPTLERPTFKGCTRDAGCGASGSMCAWTFDAKGSDLPREKHAAYKKTLLVLPSGALIPAFDNEAPTGSTYSVKGCFRNPDAGVDSAVVLLTNRSLRSNALCLSNRPPKPPGTTSAPTVAPAAPAVAPPLPSDAGAQRALIISAFAQGLKGYMIRYPSAVADFYHNGTLSNLNESFKAFFKYGKYTGESMNFERGCVAMQGATRAAIEPVMTRPGILWEAHRLVVGNVAEHHAVALYKKGASMEMGIVLDPWIAQTNDMAKSVFAFAAWKSKMFHLVMLGRPRLED